MACCRKLFWQKLYISCAANFAVHPAWQPSVQIFVTTCMCATNRTMLSCIGATSYNPNRRGLGWNFAVVEKKIRFRITKTFRFCRSNLETHGIMIPNYLRLNGHFVFEKAKMKIGRSNKIRNSGEQSLPIAKCYTSRFSTQQRGLPAHCRQKKSYMLSSDEILKSPPRSDWTI